MKKNFTILATAILGLSLFTNCKKDNGGTAPTSYYRLTKQVEEYTDLLNPNYSDTRTSTYSYNSDGILTEEQYSDVAGNTTYTYTYNDDGKVISNGEDTVIYEGNLAIAGSSIEIYDTFTIINNQITSENGGINYTWSNNQIVAYEEDGHKIESISYVNQYFSGNTFSDPMLALLVDGFNPILYVPYWGVPNQDATVTVDGRSQVMKDVIKENAYAIYTIDEVNSENYVTQYTMYQLDYDGSGDTTDIYVYTLTYETLN